MKDYGKNKEKYDRLLAMESKENVTFRKDTTTPQEAPQQTGIGIQRGPTLQSRFSSQEITMTNFSKKFLKFSTKALFGWLGIPTKYDEMTYYAKWWKFYDNCITFSNILIILLAFYDYELNFSYPRKITADYNSVRLVMIALAFLNIFCSIRRHHIKYKWKNVRILEKIYIDDAYGEENIEDKIFGDDRLILGDKQTSLFTRAMFFDIIINLIMPYPGLDFIISTYELDRDKNELVKLDYLFSDFIYIIVLLRSLYIIRAMINYSIFSDFYAFQISKEHKVKNNIRFALKCLLKIHHIKLVIWFFMGSVVIFGFMLRILDRPFWVEKGKIEFDNFFIPMWCVFVTMLTIGYGDFSPLTLAGKIVVYFASLWGVFICSLIIVCLQGLLDLSNDQFIVFTKVLKSRVAIQFIENAYVFYKNKILLSKKYILQTKNNYLSMTTSFEEFKNMRNESKSIYRSNGLLHYNMKLLKEMKKVNNRMDKIEIDLEAAKKTLHN
jgi:hypothetical protein